MGEAIPAVHTGLFRLLFPRVVYAGSRPPDRHDQGPKDSWAASVLCG
jgi:hypothetical protein